MTIRKRVTILLAVASGVLTIALYFGRWTVTQVRHEVDSARQENLVALEGAKVISHGLSTLSVRFRQLSRAALTGSSEREERALDQVSSALEQTYRAIESVHFAISSAHASRGGGIDGSPISPELAKLHQAVVAIESSWLAAQTATSPQELVRVSNAAADQSSEAVDRSLKLQNTLIRDTSVDLERVALSLKHVETIVNVVGAMLLCLAVAGSLLISRWLSRKLDVLCLSSKRIAAGSIDVRVDETSNDEFGEVARAFNGMVDSLQATQRQLEYDALHDGLTGLPNRTLFLDRVTQRLCEARRTSDYDFALLFLDLDHFKRVNDVFGHAAGDDLLRVVAGRLVALMRELDQRYVSRNTVSRLGGDEFTILIERFSEADREQFMRDIAAQIQAVIAAPVTVGGREMQMSVSCGIIMGSPDREDAASVLRDADAALYRAKAHGRGRYATYDVTLHESIAKRLELEHDLRFALDRNELSLHFQPISDLRHDHAVGFEALLRWKREGRMIGPDQFIPIAEETGLIIKLGEWVITEACRHLQQWRAVSSASIVVSVNVSPRQLSDKHLVQHLKDTMARFDISPDSLIIEITETAIVERGPACEALAAIRSLGVRVFMDDFGTGYSTLGSLNDYPVDGIKLDRSFIHKNEGQAEQLAVIEAVVRLAHQLKMPVVAEGVETALQLEVLQQLGCDKIQGYYLSRPMPAEQVLAYLRESPAQRSAA